MYNEELELLIEAALADGILTEKEKQVLFKKAQSLGIDLDEFEVVLDARLIKLQKEEKEKAAKSAPKSEKLGDVRKCPQCGAVIGSFQMICPDCGFEFSNVGPNKYVKKFSHGLDELVHTTEFGKQHGYMRLFDFQGDYEQHRRGKILEQAEARYVKNYPLPMTKEDCVEMLNFILPKISLSGSNSATFAWKKKYAAIISKMERECVGNDKMLKVIESYKKQGKINGFSSFIIWYKSLSKIVKSIFWLGIFYIAFFGAGSVLWKSLMNDDHDENLDLLVKQCIDKGDIEGAKAAIRDGGQSLPLYEYFMENQMWEDAEEYLPKSWREPSNQDYFDYCKKAVTTMCELGQFKEAKKFIKRKVVFYEKYNNSDADDSAQFKEDCVEWNTDVVSKRLNAIVDNY